MSLLSIIVPLFNQKEYIQQCISSIQAQSLEEIKIIIVDDGSTDGSEGLCDKLSEEDERITVIHQENRGLAGARLSGLRTCETKYVTFVDADDFVLADSYIRALKYMQQDIDMVFFEITRYFDVNNCKWEKHIFDEGFYDKKRIEEEVYKKLIWDFEQDNPGMECSQCVRITKKDLLLEQYNNLSVNLYYGEDIVITYPLYLKLKTMQIVSYSYYMHRQHHQICQSYIISEGYFDEIFRLYTYLIEKFSDEDDRFDFIRQIEYLYMHISQLKKRKYLDDFEKIHFLFPFDRVCAKKRILLYGAGDVGRSYYFQLTKINYCKDLLWVDRNAANIGDPRVEGIDRIKEFDPDMAVIAIRDNAVSQTVSDYLIGCGIDKDSIIY